MIIGSGNEEQKIKHYISKHNLTGQVKLLGRVDRKNVQIHINNSQVFIMISKDETFGLVYLEAMA